MPPYVGMARKQNGGYNASISVQTPIFHLVVNRPFPIRAKYAWNACVGVLPCLDGLGDSTGVRDDYVMAGVYTRIYMALMGNISIRLTSV